MTAGKGTGEQGLFQPYDQFLLFGDSITEFSCNQGLGYSFHAALQFGTYYSMFWGKKAGELNPIDADCLN